MRALKNSKDLCYFPTKGLCHLSKTLPQDFLNMSALETYFGDHGGISGTIPDHLSPNLKRLELAFTPTLNGTLPRSLST